MTRTFTNSELSSYRSCPARWGYSYAELLTPISEAPSAASWGSLAHAALRVGIDGLSAGWAMDRIERALDDELRAAPNPEEITQVKQVVMRELQRGTFDQHQVLATEYAFKVPFGADREYAGQIDLITREQSTQQIVVWDHKFVANLDSYESRAAIDTQAAGYIYAVDWLAKSGLFGAYKGQISRFTWNLIRRKVPREPTVLLAKKGDFKVAGEWEEASRVQAQSGACGLVSSAAVDTTVQIYAAALHRQVQRGFPITENQGERLAELGTKRWNHLQEHFVSRDDVDRWAREAIVIMRRAESAEERPEERTRSPEACSMFPCRFSEICLIDSPETRAAYRIRDARHHEIQEQQKEEPEGE